MALATLAQLAAYLGRRGSQCVTPTQNVEAHVARNNTNGSIIRRCGGRLRSEACSSGKCDTDGSKKSSSYAGGRRRGAAGGTTGGTATAGTGIAEAAGSDSGRSAGEGAAVLICKS